MKSYTKLSDWDRKQVDENLERELDPDKTFMFQEQKYNNKEYITDQVHQGHYCAECWNVYYNCVCSHEN